MGCWKPFLSSVINLINRWTLPNNWALSTILLLMFLVTVVIVIHFLSFYILLPGIRPMVTHINKVKESNNSSHQYYYSNCKTSCFGNNSKIGVFFKLVIINDLGLLERHFQVQKLKYSAPDGNTIPWAMSRMPSAAPTDHLKKQYEEEVPLSSHWAGIPVPVLSD